MADMDVKTLISLPDILQSVNKYVAKYKIFVIICILQIRIFDLVFRLQAVKKGRNVQNHLKWPYRPQVSESEQINADVLVLGGGIAGCMAAIAAARKGQKVVLVEKGATKRSGAGGSGCDHWESAATNPCSGVTPEELVNAMLDDNDGYNNAISHYIECREGWDRLLDIEKMGGKIRDTEDEFEGADFRDEDTKLLFAYDYQNRFTLRVWGTTFKPAMEKGA